MAGTRDAPMLDNAVWHALRGPLARFRAPHSTPGFVHFERDVGIFSGVERVDAAGWREIEAAVGPEGFCGLFRDEVPPAPSGWEELYREPCWQMLAGDLVPSRGLDIEVLGAEVAAEMLALAELTEPAPFFLRTPELGRYVGVRRGGRLVAMAGERLRVPGFVEISAVCTHPDVRREGLGAELTLEVARAIRAGGDEAFLHVLESNENAFRLYRKLGFVVRRRVEVVFARRLAEA